MSHTQSTESTEFPFRSMWCSSFNQPSLSLTLKGSNGDGVPTVRSGSSIQGIKASGHYQSQCHCLDEKESKWKKYKGQTW